MKKIFFALVTVLITVYACDKQASGNTNTGSTGIGGSLARFTIVGNYLYLADDNYLSVYSIASPSNTTFIKKVFMGNSIETIYPYNNTLFIGSRLGMYMYGLTDPENPTKLGEALHVRSCDPVVAKDTFAFVTLRGGGACGGATNALYTYSVKNIASPLLLNTLALPKPIGLGYKDTTLFICCEDSGLAVINIANPKIPAIKRYIKSNTFYDVIPLNNNLLVCMVKNGIDIYNIADVNNILFVKNIGN